VKGKNAKWKARGQNVGIKVHQRFKPGHQEPNNPDRGIKKGEKNGKRNLGPLRVGVGRILQSGKVKKRKTER